MLELPTTGVARSINNHNSNLFLFCDWLEANALFFEDRLSFSDVIDQLLEDELYDFQDFAWEFVGNSLSELRKRALHLQRAYPLAVTDRHLKSRNEGGKHPYLFCLLVSLLPFYSSVKKSFGPDHNSQAVLLERLAELSLAKLFPSWAVRRTGWSRMSNRTLPTIARELAEFIDSGTGDLRDLRKYPREGLWPRRYNISTICRRSRWVPVHAAAVRIRTHELAWKAQGAGY